MIQDRTAIMSPMLPEDPEPGCVHTLPEGQIAGGANVLSVFRWEIDSKSGKLIGSTNNLVPVSNVTGKYYTERLSSSQELKKNDVIRIVARQFNFNQITFVEYFGWIGSGVTSIPTTLSDKIYRVLTAIPIGPNTPNFWLYEKVCLEIINKEKKNESTPETTPAT